MRPIDAGAMTIALRLAAKQIVTSDSEWLKGYRDGLNAASKAIEEAAVKSQKAYDAELWDMPPLGGFHGE